MLFLEILFQLNHSHKDVVRFGYTKEGEPGRRTWSHVDLIKNDTSCIDMLILKAQGQLLYKQDTVHISIHCCMFYQVGTDL